MTKTVKKDTRGGSASAISASLQQLRLDPNAEISGKLRTIRVRNYPERYIDYNDYKNKITDYIHFRDWLHDYITKLLAFVIWLQNCVTICYKLQM